MTDEAKEKRNAYMRQWRAKNRERVKAHQKKWREKNRDYNRKYWEQKAEEEGSMVREMA